MVVYVRHPVALPAAAALPTCLELAKGPVALFRVVAQGASTVRLLSVWYLYKCGRKGGLG